MASCERHSDAGTSIHGNCNDCGKKATSLQSPILTHREMMTVAEITGYRYYRTARCPRCQRHVEFRGNPFMLDNPQTKKLWTSGKGKLTVGHSRTGLHSAILEA